MGNLVFVIQISPLKAAGTFHLSRVEDGEQDVRLSSSPGFHLSGRKYLLKEILVSNKEGNFVSFHVFIFIQD